MMGHWNYSIIVFLALNGINPAHALTQDCSALLEVQNTVTTTETTLDSFLDYQQKRFEVIYPELYHLGMESGETAEITHTLELLELRNNQKKLFSDLEYQFSALYREFAQRGQDAAHLHEYFRSIVRGDLEQAKLAGDEILTLVEKEKQSNFSKNYGIFSSTDPRWNDFKIQTPIQTSLIEYSDHGNEQIKGIKIDWSDALPGQRPQLELMAKAMERNHQVTIASVPQAVERLHSNGFSVRKASYLNLEKPDAEEVVGPMIVIPQNNIDFDHVSNTTRHEARHAFYNSARKAKKSSAVDSHVAALPEKTLGATGGYSQYQSYEEVSTHSKDLLAAYRTGNREILKLYHRSPILKANHIFDIAFLESKALTVKNITAQTFRTSEAALKEIQRMKTAPFEEVLDIQIKVTSEGYEFTFPVDETFLISTFLSAPEERSAVTRFVAEYERLQAGEANNAKVMFSEALVQLEKKIQRSKDLAQKVGVLADNIIVITDSFRMGNLDLNKTEYLKIRDIIAKPAVTVTRLIQ